MNFAQRDRMKRVKQAKDLFAKGFTVRRLSEYFDVSEDTVESYLKEEIQVDENNVVIVGKEKKMTTLDAFSSKTTTVDNVLPDVEKTGARCKCCNEYKKFQFLIDWNPTTKVCKDCYNSLDSEKMRKLNRA